MLASRLLSTLMLLQTRGRMSAPDLAKQLEVSVRTIYRDIDQLSAAGIPVMADRGRDGGFQLLNGFRTQLTGLTQAEAEALMLAGLPGPAAELGLADRMSSARLKLMAALPAGMRAERVATRFHLDVTGWFRATEPVALLPTVARAVWSESYLRIRYRQGGNSNESCSRPAFGTSSRKRAAPIAHTGRQIFRRWNLSMSHSHAPRALI
jgi:predicted DNA-binding transcriptional regulator YafY